jgi:hypothetical protein
MVKKQWQWWINHQVAYKIPPYKKKRTARFIARRTGLRKYSHMYYYEITASKARDSIRHREYAAFVTRSDADQLRAALESNYDVVGVIRITRKQYLARVSEI